MTTSPDRLHAIRREIDSKHGDLPYLFVPKVPLPEDHPDHATVLPDDSEYRTDLAFLARKGREMWIKVRAGARPSITRSIFDQICDERSNRGEWFPK